MLKWFLVALAWVAISYPVYHYAGPGWLIGYGVVSLVALLVWAGTRK